MHVVDTNVVVRYVTNDDPKQSPVARRFVDAHQVRASWTVLLETEWVLRSAHKLTRQRIVYIMRQFVGLPTVSIVLRSAHKLTRQRIVYIMRQFVGLPTVSIDEPEHFAQVVDWFAQGMDFADAMHLSGCEDGEALATFD